MDDLIAWLRGVLDEVERLALAATPGAWAVNDPEYVERITAGYGTPVVDGSRWDGEASVFETSGDAVHIAFHDPARVLAEVEAKRRILEAVDDVRGYEAQIDMEWGTSAWAEDAPDRASVQIARLLALPYADRPGYREEWRP